MPDTITHSEQSGEQFQLLVRLWQTRSGGTANFKSSSRLRAKELIEDILAAKFDGKPEASEEGYLSSIGIGDAFQALAASQALQLAFEGFREADPPGHASVSIMLAQAAESSVEQVSLLELAKPSQVLITQSFYDWAAHFHPLRLRSFPPRAGVYEFLWTDEARLDELGAEAQSVPALVVLPAAPSAPLLPPPVPAPPAAPVPRESAKPARLLRWLETQPVAAASVLLTIFAMGGAGYAAWHFEHGRPARHFSVSTILLDPIHQDVSELVPYRELAPIRLESLDLKPSIKPLQPRGANALLVSGFRSISV